MSIQPVRTSTLRTALDKSLPRKSGPGASNSVRPHCITRRTACGRTPIDLALGVVESSHPIGQSVTHSRDVIDVLGIVGKVIHRSMDQPAWTGTLLRST